MEDRQIIDLYWARNEDAIRETAGKYGAYLDTVAYHILADREDCEECVNDTYLRAWNAMPPHRPDLLRVFLAKLTRACSIDCVRRKTAKRRGSSTYTASLDEWAAVLSGGGDPADVLEAKRLTEAIEQFLAETDADQRRMFLCRYYFFDPIADIAQFFGCTQAKVKSVLFRMRRDLKEYLTKEGFAI